MELRYAVSVKYTMDFEEDSMKNRMQNASVIYLCLLHVKIIILDILDHIKYVTKINIMFLCSFKMWLLENLKLYMWLALYFYYIFLNYIISYY